MIKYKTHLDKINRKDTLIDKSKYKWRLDQSERISEYSDKFFTNFINTLTDTDFICYPYVKQLKQKLAKHHNINEVDNIFLTPGSDIAIRTMFDLCVTENSEVLTTNPCFPMYDVYCKLYNAELKSVNYDKNLTWNIDYVMKNITDKTSLIIIANPNNPIGDYKKPSELDELFRYTQKKGIPVLIDEAYVQFIPNNYETCITKGFEFNNVVTCRTFSKALGAAGVRIGYMITNTSFMEKIKKWRLMFEVTGISAKFGCYILDNYIEVEKYINSTNTEKDLLVNELSKKYDIISSHCNWIHVNDENDNKFICSVLDKYSDVTYKAGTSIPYDDRINWLRMTVGPEILKTDFIKEILRKEIK